MRGEAAAIAATLLTPCAVSRIACTRIGFFTPCARFEQREILVDEMDVPGALDLGNHHDVELVADLADDARQVVEKPRRIQRIDAHP